MKNYIWVIEMEYDGRWFATIGVGLNREDARIELKNWQYKNEGKFRIRKYTCHAQGEG